MFRFRKKYFSGFGNVAFITAGSLLVLAVLFGFIFVNFGGDFLSTEVDLETESSDLITDPAKASSSPPLLAKILPPAKETAGLGKQGGVNFNAAKPAASPEDNFVSVGENFFANQAVGGSEEIEPGPLIKLVISEVLFGAKDSAKEEFIELHNPNNFVVELSKWELRKKTENGNDSVLVSSEKFLGAIQPKSYFLISYPDFSEKFGADLAWSSKSYSISENNAIYLFDDFGRQIDLIGCGSAFDYESAACIVPETGVSISRPDNADTDNNQKDFSFSKPTPKQSFVAYVYPSAEASPLPQQASPTPSQSSPTPSPQTILIPASSLIPSPSPVSSPIATPEPPILSPSPSLLPSPSPTLPAKLLINKIQITGGEGKTKNDFIEIYNPNAGAVNLKNYRLVKRTKTGGEDGPVKSFTDDFLVNPYSTLVWANNDYLEAAADFRTGSIVSDNNAVAIRYGPENTGEVIDSVGWGEYAGIFCESSCFLTNPGAGEVLKRKSHQDTGDNSSDFEIVSLN